MADTSAIDDAVIGRLTGDATLMALTTDGAYYDVAPNGLTRFLIVSQVIHLDDYVFEGRAMESVTYLVKAVFRDAVAADIIAAAARIDALLQGVALTITGYSHCLTSRSERVRYTEVDDVDANIRWQHRGGRYEVVVST